MYLNEYFPFKISNLEEELRLYRKNNFESTISIHKYVKIGNFWNLEPAEHCHKGQKNLQIYYFGSAPYRVGVNFF